MKTLLLAAALLATTPALAQVTNSDTATPASNQGTTPEGPNTPSQTTEQMATPNQSAGDSMSSGSGSVTPSSDIANPDSYPACSRTVHDKCVQRGGHMRPHA